MKIYIIHAHLNEHGDISEWVEKVFQNEMQAMHCAAYLNLATEQDNLTFSVIEHDICNEDYVTKLNELLEGDDDFNK